MSPRAQGLMVLKTAGLREAGLVVALPAAPGEAPRENGTARYGGPPEDEEPKGRLGEVCLKQLVSNREEGSRAATWYFFSLKKSPEHRSDGGAILGC